MAKQVSPQDPLLAEIRLGTVDKFKALLKNGGYDVNCVDAANGMTLLLHACECGNLPIVRELISNFNASLTVRDKCGRTAPVIAASTPSGHFHVVLALLLEYKYSVTDKDDEGWTLFRMACDTYCYPYSNHESAKVVRILLRDHRAAVNIDVENRKKTAYELALAKSNVLVVLCLVDEFGFDPCPVLENAQDLLNKACQIGSVEHVHCLINKYRARINQATYHVSRRPWYKGWATPLQVASLHCQCSVVQALLKCESISTSLVDQDGNTALHIVSELKCAKLLVDAGASLSVRNNYWGYTPVDKAKKYHRTIFKYFEEINNQISASCSEYLRSSKKYSGSHCITRVFVLGDTGTGKSSFIESFKKEGFFELFRKASASPALPHTVGIVPSVHMSKHLLHDSVNYLFYDFAGDGEYLSSHAAILERLASSVTGENVFVVVVDLREDGDTIKAALLKWFSFIQHQKFSKFPLLVVGSHFDERSSGTIHFDKKFVSGISKKMNNIECFMLDCRDPRSSQLVELKKQITTWRRHPKRYEISIHARVLLGMLEKDLKSVVACPIQMLISHIKKSGLVCLPTKVDFLHAILKELHEEGLLLLLGNGAFENDHIVLDISKLTCEVHQLLFSRSEHTKSPIKSQDPALLDIGIISQSFLAEILPPHITKECLVHLQYCQEVSNSEISFFSVQEPGNSTGQSYLFFPALCIAKKSSVVWDDYGGNDFTVSWLALCTDPLDSFPARFLHVLLLRLLAYFLKAQSVAIQEETASPSASLCSSCIMWKDGIHWKTVLGVECQVELVKGSKGIVVFTRSSNQNAENCSSVFGDVVKCVMETREDFCHSLKLRCYLFDFIAEADSLSEDRMIAMSHVESVLESRVSGSQTMELYKMIKCMHKLTHWDNLFPIQFKDVLQSLSLVPAEKLSDLGLRLGAPSEFLRSLESKFSSEDQKKELVLWWMKSAHSLYPCWWKLVEALKDVELREIAEDITKEHGKYHKFYPLLLYLQKNAFEV